MGRSSANPSMHVCVDEASPSLAVFDPELIAPPENATAHTTPSTTLPRSALRKTLVTRRPTHRVSPTPSSSEESKSRVSPEMDATITAPPCRPLPTHAARLGPATPGNSRHTGANLRPPWGRASMYCPRWVVCINENEGCCVVTRRKHSIEVRLKATAAPFNSVLKGLGHRQVDTPRAISSPK